MKSSFTIFLVLFLGVHCHAQNSKACQNGSLKIFLNTPDSIEHLVNTPYIPTKVTVSDSFSPPDKISLTYWSNVTSNRLGIYFDEYVAQNEKGMYNICKRYIWIVEGSLDVQKLEKGEFRISANPTTDGFITISFDQPSRTKRIELISINGIVVSEISEIQKENKLALPTPSIYFLKIYYSDSTSKVLKVMRID